MNDIRQLLTKDLNDTKNIFPFAYTEGITEKATGKSLRQILNGFNSYFVSFATDVKTTRNSVPVIVRKQGTELTYVDYNDNIISERFIGKEIDDTSWSDDKNWSVIKTNVPFYKVENNIFYYSQDGINWTKAGSIRNTNVYVSETEPDDSEDINLWIDPSNTSLLNEDSDETKGIKRRLKELENKIEGLSKLNTIGIIAGNSTSSYRRQIMKTAEPEKPEAFDGDVNDTDDKPSTEGLEPTTTHISVKSDTVSNISANRQDLIDSELLFYTDKHRLAIYYQGKFYIIGSDGSGSGDGGLSVDDLYNLEIKNLTFTNGNNLYKIFVNTDGKWQISEYNKNEIKAGSIVPTWNVYIEHLLCINEVFCGGDGTNPLVSHSFVELANGSNYDINLNGLHLLYTDLTKEDNNDVGYKWHVLDLQGVIKAGSTFLIRGAKCRDTKSSFIPIDTYDMEWREDNALLSFKQGNASFYLIAGDNYKEQLEKKTLSSPWSLPDAPTGYIDSCGFGEHAVREGSGAFLVNTSWDNALFVRWFMLDPCKQGNKAYAARSTTGLWAYIDLSKFDEEMGNSIQYYYPDYMKQKFTPKASYQEKNFFTNKNTFKSDKPNYLNITFGIQATDNGKGATRCFNWISVGYYNEYLEYRLKGTDTWNRVYSITKNNVNNTEAINKFIEHYQRLRWCTSDGTWVTTHKCIVYNLKAGEYEYKVGRDNDSYTSEVLSFSVKEDKDVTSFSFIQTTDQQGFNWAEYQAWKKSAYVISKNENNYDFTINTGDITQNGNRVNEWLDYYDGRQYLRDKEEMFTIGNNDLCGYDATQLTDGEDATSKYNHINILRYFTFELDVNNDYSFTWNDVNYPLYSLYSYNYGKYHFICLNSEIAIASSKTYKDWQDDRYSGDASMANAANAAIENWLKKDLENYKGKKNPTDCSNCIVYMHEMPFTIVTWGFMSGNSARAGSHLNILNDNGLYRFSRLFKQYGIRLVLGGHKHTYSISKPIYDAPTDYIVNNTASNTVDIMKDLTVEDTRKPVIQVLSSNDIKISDYARYELVNKINAPVYVMSQATGYKLVSNKEQPSGSDYVIPWLMSYFKAKSNNNNPTENVAQHYPMYIRYDLTPDNITVTAKQIHNIWDVNIDKNNKKFDMNKQLVDLNPVNMTLSTATDEDITAYNITNKESYIINL